MVCNVCGGRVIGFLMAGGSANIEINFDIWHAGEVNAWKHV